MSFDLLTIFGAGMLTFLTPCVLPLIPIYLAALTGGSVVGLSGKERGRLLIRAVLFSFGFVLVFTAMGFGASSIGSFLSSNKTLMQGVGAVIVLVFALKFLGFIKIPFLDRVVKADDTKMSTRFGAINAFIMGIVFAAGWSPCVGPVLGSILTYTASAAASPTEGAMYLSVYGIGFAIPLIATAAFAEAGMKLIGRLSAHLPKIEKGIGIVLLFIAGMLVFDTVQALSYSTPPAAETTVASDSEISNRTNLKRLPTMVELYKEDCTVCQKMKPTVEAITNQCDEKGVHVKTIDIGKPENRHLIRQYNLVGVPTFVFLDEKGNEASRLVGEQTEAALKQTISVIRGEPCPGVALLSPAEFETTQQAEMNCNI
ncbi:MAG: sulfite exporter TauE/SafE family protein [Deltaproteobacteria bacterium]|nr:sulfite exporter TauE/SafE family protein [Deltaproteobacteria bacterium]MBN2671754.1 sulfite exporter TauE/SafE family protein [Deltaproteobacteria bacterium]